MNTNFNNELQQLQMELRAQNFDIIRFSTYRTACKLRFIQKKLNFHLLDLLNVIESLRESLTSLSSELYFNNLTSIKSCRSTFAPSLLPNNNQFLSINHLTIFLTSIYTNLNKRLPISQQIHHIDNCVQSAIAWFLYVYNTNKFFMRFNSFRVILVILCNGKLIDKIRHLFTSCLSTSSINTLTYGQIDELLHDILALPYALQEISLSTYQKNYAQTIFSHLSSPITLTNFLDILIYNNTTKPNCLQWLIIFHRLISVENVIHRIQCSACQRPSFSGFRYKCQQCHNRTYQLCQDCFWRGRISNQHLSTHEMKEYTYFIPSKKYFRQSIRKSFQCMPKTEKSNQLSSSLTIDKEQKLSEHLIQSDTIKLKNLNENKINSDEHQQIALYTKQFAIINNKLNLNSNQISSQIKYHSQRKYTDHKTTEKKFLISKLESENRRILHEINTLRTQLKYRSASPIPTNNYHAYSDTDIFSTIEQPYTQTLSHSYLNFQNKISSYPFNPIQKIRRTDSVEISNKNSYLSHELRILLTRKHQLQKHRDELISQLNNLENILHYSSPLQQRSATSTPHRHLSLSPIRTNSSFRSYSTPTTPIHKRLINHSHTNLLQAADSLTSAMSSLIQQLNTEDIESDFNYFSYDSENQTDDSFILYNHQ